MFTNKRYFLYLLVLLTHLPLRSLANEISFSRITDGISSNFVNCITQTADGFIWVGTKNGLQRYDGVRFRHVGSSLRGGSLPPLPVDQLFVPTGTKQLLVRMGHRIGLMDTQTYRFQETMIDGYTAGFQNYQIRIIQQDDQLFLILHGIDILTFNRIKNRFERNRRIINFPGGWNPTWLQFDASGRIWISGKAGLGYFDRQKQQFVTARSGVPFFSSPFRHIHRFFIDARNRFFIYEKERHSNGILSLADPFTGQRKHIRAMPNPQSNYHDFYGFTEHAGMIWGYGVDVFNLFEESDGHFATFFSPDNPDHGIRVTTVSQLFKDHDGHIWVATDNGLYSMSIIQDHIRNILTGRTFGTAAMTDIAALADNRILASSWGGRLAVYAYDKDLKITEDQKMMALLYRQAPKGDRQFNKVWAIAQAPNTGDIWAGCQAGRLIRFSPHAGKSEFMAPPIFGGQSVRSIAVASDGCVWFGTDDGRIIRRSGDRFELLAHLESTISCIHPGNNGNMWIGTLGSGVFEHDMSTGKIRRNYTSDQHGLTSSRIRDIETVGRSILAIAGNSGLDLLDLSTGKITNRNVQNGLPQNVVTALVSDAQGMLWMSTTAGICRYDFRSDAFRSFDKRSGLVNTSSVANLLNRGVRLGDRLLAFCGDRNIVVFDPSKVNEPALPKDVHITDFKLFDTYLSVDSLMRNGGVRLEHAQNFFTIAYSSFSYDEQEHLRYYYRLMGSDSTWIRSERQLSTTFASLSPGDYTFMIRSQNQDGKFSKITSLPITIKPAFYQTWWFMALCMMAVVGGVFLFHRYRLRRLLEVHRLREKVARDLHDDVGSTLTSIGILSEVAQQGLTEEQSAVRSYLTRIGGNSAQMMQAMDDIVWSIKPDNDQLHKIVSRMREHTAQVLEPLHIAYTFRDDDHQRTVKLTMEQRRNIFLIFKEALNNAVKYASATSITITVQTGGGYVQLIIADDGKGFDTAHLPNGNGLRNMQQRSRDLGGQLSISSIPGSGTTITMQMRL